MVRGAIDDYKNLSDVYDQFIIFQVIELIMVGILGVVYSGEVDSVYVVVGYTINLIDWGWFEFLRIEGNKVMDGEAPIVEFVQLKSYMELIYYIFPISIIGGIIYVLP